MPQAAPIDNRLNGLQEIALPEAASYLPQTIGWYLLLGAALCGLAWLGFNSYRKWQRNRYRRAALKQLQEIRHASGSDPSVLAELPDLVKRTALGFSARTQVADLYGTDWLAFLDRTYAGSGFSEGPGRVLPTLSYSAAPSLADTDRHELFALLELWIRKHRA